jgi:hypothetical protein
VGGEIILDFVRKSKLPLKKLYTFATSSREWERYGKMRYKIEQMFGSIKQKIGSSFCLCYSLEPLYPCHIFIFVVATWRLVFTTMLKGLVDF